MSVAGQMDSGFWEVGASGTTYSRELVIEILLRRYAESTVDEWESEDWAISEAACRELDEGTFLLTYVLRQVSRVTRRATIRHRADQGWKVVHHQGTIVDDSAA